MLPVQIHGANPGLLVRPARRPEVGEGDLKPVLPLLQGDRPGAQCMTGCSRIPLDAVNDNVQIVAGDNVHEVRLGRRVKCVDAFRRHRQVSLVPHAIRWSLGRCSVQRTGNRLALKKTRGRSAARGRGPATCRSKSRNAIRKRSPRQPPAWRWAGLSRTGDQRRQTAAHRDWHLGNALAEGPRL